VISYDELADFIDETDRAIPPSLRHKKQDLRQLRSLLKDSQALASLDFVGFVAVVTVPTTVGQKRISQATKSLLNAWASFSFHTGGGDMDWRDFQAAMAAFHIAVTKKQAISFLTDTCPGYEPAAAEDFSQMPAPPAFNLESFLRLLTTGSGEGDGSLTKVEDVAIQDLWISQSVKAKRHEATLMKVHLLQPTLTIVNLPKNSPILESTLIQRKSYLSSKESWQVCGPLSPGLMVMV